MKNTIKNLIVALLIAITMASCVGGRNVEAKSKYSSAIKVAKKYHKTKEAKKIEDKIRKRYGKNTYLKIRKDNKTWDKILTRKKGHKCYVTWTVGKALKTRKDKSGVDGVDLYENPKYNYIGYPMGTKKGTIVLSYFVWCNECNEADDIVARYDVVLKKGK